MHHVALVGVGQTAADLPEDDQRHGVGKVAALPDKPLQGDAVHVLQNDVVKRALPEMIVHVDDRIVAQIHHDLRLPPEPLPDVRVASEGQLLDDHRPLQGGVLRRIHRPHPALGETVDHWVLSDGIRDLWCHISSYLLRRLQL